jgi:hypothetical protein
MKGLLLCTLSLLALPIGAAQFAKFGDTEVHYVVVNSTFITSETAAKYGLEQAPDRAFVNLSVLKAGIPASAEVAGTATNLLGRSSLLEFREVTEGPAIYYLAPLEFDDEETLRFAIDVALPGEPVHHVTFQETLFQEPE